MTAMTATSSVHMHSVPKSTSVPQTRQLSVCRGRSPGLASSIDGNCQGEQMGSSVMNNPGCKAKAHISLTRHAYLHVEAGSRIITGDRIRFTGAFLRLIRRELGAE